MSILILDSTLDASAAANNGDSSALDASATASDGGSTYNNVSFQQLSCKWRSAHRDDLKLRHFTGLWLNVKHGPPTSRQDYGKGTLKKYQTSLGVGESDVSRMRWFAFEFKSIEDLKAKHPKATTWTKVKEVLAQLRRPQAAPAGTIPSDAMKLVVKDRPVDQLIGAMKTLQAHVAKVGKLTPGGVEWNAVQAAFAGVMKEVEACLDCRFTFTTATTPGQPVASPATDSAGQTQMLAFGPTSVVEMPASVFGPGGNGHAPLQS
jgi:hypothetical protein